MGELLVGEVVSATQTHTTLSRGCDDDGGGDGDSDGDAAMTKCHQSPDVCLWDENSITAVRRIDSSSPTLKSAQPEVLLPMPQTLNNVGLPAEPFLHEKPGHGVPVTAPT